MSEASPEERVYVEDLREVWAVLTEEDRLAGWRRLPAEERDDFFLELDTSDQAALVLSLPVKERRLWVRLLPPDDLADVLQTVEPSERHALMELLDQPTAREISALLAYEEDAAGGLMNPRFARVRRDSTVEEAVTYLRKQAQDHFARMHYAYVLDAGQRLVGVVSFRELFAASTGSIVADVMEKDVVSVPETMDQEQVATLFAKYGFVALPVVDAAGVMRGVVSADDVVDVVKEEATEDIQKLGGMEALEDPYLRTTFASLFKKRAGWLAVLFMGEMLTATAMAKYESEIASAVVLAVFIPLIISSGGNSGSQATTLVIRAMALEEVRPRDWWRVARREVFMGLALGGVLAAFGAARVLVWQHAFHSYGEHAELLAVTIGVALIGVVTWGTVVGSMLPFVLRALRLDPASASAPLVATLVDVLGIVIYFNVAAMMLGGSLL